MENIFHFLVHPKLVGYYYAASPFGGTLILLLQ